MNGDSTLIDRTILSGRVRRPEETSISVNGYIPADQRYFVALPVFAGLELLFRFMENNVANVLCFTRG